MPNPVAAIIGGSVIGAGSSIYGANKAASATSKAADQATRAQLDMYYQGRSDMAPYREAGYSALDQIAQLYGLPPINRAATGAPGGAAGAPAPGGGTGMFAGAVPGLAGQLAGPLSAWADANRTPGAAPATAAAPTTRDLSAFYASPQYQFNRAEGLRGLENSAAARGGAFSGNAIRGAEQFASNLASGEFNSYVDRLFNIAGLGNSSSAASASAAQSTGGNLAQIYQNAGNARGSAYLAGAGGVNNALQGGLQNYMMFDYLRNQPVYSGGLGTGK